ncbi:MAG: P-loop NTPase [Fibrobacterota bacterium]
MKIAVASGKGGVGKTTAALSLAHVMGPESLLCDCDAEEPNCHLFCRDDRTEIEDVTVKVPEISAELCTKCGKCGAFCQYNAIVALPGQTPLFFSELCHSCGGCALVCPAGAITERNAKVGRINRTTRTDGGILLDGAVTVGMPLVTAVISQLLKKTQDHDQVIIDAPPGTACPFVEAVSDADYVILVTEPTPFGLNDLKLAEEFVRTMNIPFGVIINRVEDEENEVAAYCQSENITLLMQIPFRRDIALACAEGAVLTQFDHSVKTQFAQTVQFIRECVQEAL